MKKRLLDSVTLLTVTSIKLEDSVDALKYNLRGMAFESVKFISHAKPPNLPKHIAFCECEPIDSLESYSRFMMYRLKDFVDTPYCLSIQRDGVIVHPKKWQDSFLNYDYIGAPWPLSEAFIDPFGNAQRVGNGGFSLRSKRFLNVPTDAQIPFYSSKNELHEDVMQCVEYRHIFERLGLAFAPMEVARHFSHEMKIPEIKGLKPFGFHKYRKQNRYYPRFPGKIQKFFKRYEYPPQKT
ncbi:MAG: hypothetical protein GF344_18785 [Chitinivibrionales bacterium]|nr:hypothetical protein [Chitinivibrionales bacterium]MBD3358692.1 hypothetical protein [Chitinivibrionales bacterium]